MHVPTELTCNNELYEYTFISTFSINQNKVTMYDTKAFSKTYPLILNSTQAFAQGVGYVKALLLKG